MINKAYLILGGNMGNRAAMLANAEQLLTEERITISASSSVYETAPWQMNGCDAFLNKVLVTDTDLSATALMAACLKVEEKLGRKRTEGGYSSRTIDVDILFFNDEVIVSPNLHIPHPRLHLRKFVLKPLLEVAANHLHPLLKKKISELYEQCEDQGEVTLYKSGATN